MSPKEEKERDPTSYSGLMTDYSVLLHPSRRTAATAAVAATASGSRERPSPPIPAPLPLNISSVFPCACREALQPSHLRLVESVQ